MITVPQIDRLVISDDTIAAHLWPRLGPRVRTAYTADRDGWVMLRRKVEAGEMLPATTLASQHKVFSGWARAFRDASSRQKHTAARTAHPTAPAGTVAAAAAAPAVAAPATAPLAAAALPSLPAIPKPKGGAGTAVAGGLLLAGLVAVAARRKRA